MESGLAVTTCSLNFFVCHLFSAGSHCVQSLKRKVVDVFLQALHLQFRQSCKTDNHLDMFVCQAESMVNNASNTLCVCVYRSMHKLMQLERLDLGSNEFTEVVSSTCLSFRCRMHYCSLSLPSSSQCSQVSDVSTVNADAFIESFSVRLHLICIFLLYWYSLKVVADFLLLRMRNWILSSFSLAWSIGAAHWNQRAVGGRK